MTYKLFAPVPSWYMPNYAVTVPRIFELHKMHMHFDFRRLPLKGSKEIHILSILLLLRLIITNLLKYHTPELYVVESSKARIWS